jgi:hypothetical protein
MHEVSLGGTLEDYLTGEARECTTYEDLRQALARWLVEEKGYAKSALVPRFAVPYQVDGETLTREADIAVFAPEGELLLLILFCPGQVNTYVREAVSMARLALPRPAPLAAVTDLREAELVSAGDKAVLAYGMAAIPGQAQLAALAGERRLPPLSEEQRAKESRILHTYTGFLKTCCGERCPRV